MNGHASKEPIVRTKGLVKRFGQMFAVRGLDLVVNEGEIYGLIGPNGSGKTTTMRMLCGILRPDEGEVYLLGSRIPSFKVLRSIGYMPQENAIYDDITVQENLCFFGRIQGLTREGINENANTILELVGLQGKRQALARDLSAGMQRRLSLAVAMIHQPVLLLLDEPTAGVDPDLRISFWKHFKELSAQGTTILITTHYLEEASRCGRVGLMSQGRLIEEGPPQELEEEAHAKTLEDAFLTLVGKGREEG
ncbi:MAG TPA: ABC transporter ATP-binding protein [Candidatus Acetothermia bacterium]|nr:ABC transporter ATP-binding protein [Candidatus Acetothermia bacterium]